MTQMTLAWGGFIAADTILVKTPAFVTHDTQTSLGPSSGLRVSLSLVAGVVLPPL